MKSRRLKWVGRVARIGEDKIAFKIVTGKPAGKPLRWFSLESNAIQGVVVCDTICHYLIGELTLYLFIYLF